MAGSNIIAICGIDGSFEDFDLFLGSRIPHYTRLTYQREALFAVNSEVMQRKLSLIPCDNTLILGWSIGAPLAMVLAEKCGIKKCLMINSFFDRETVLKAREISIDVHDNVVISDFPIYDKKIMIVAGACDDKIPYTESLKIFEYLKKDNYVNLFIEAGASHSLTTFSQDAAHLFEQVIEGAFL